MFFKKPSHDRDWSPYQAILPKAEFLDDDKVLIHHVRRATYRARDEYDLSYYDETYDLSTIEGVDFLVSPFFGYGVAHTLLVFRFAGGKQIALSVEVRRKRGEQFSMKRIMPQEYELMYVFAHPDDSVKWRSHINKDEAYLYPLVLMPGQTRMAFIDACRRANKIYEHPEFYHVLTNNCTNNLIDHLRAGGVRLPRVSWRYVLPASIDTFLLHRGLIAWQGTLDTLRAQYYITDKSPKAA